MSSPADWYPDPAGDPSILRYWDGLAWTEHTHPVPQQHQQQPQDPQPVDDAPSPTTSPTNSPEVTPIPSMTPMTSMTSGTSSGGTGSVAGIRSDLLSGQYAETDASSRVVLQNSKMLKVRLGEPVLARQGSMVAFQGRVDFDHEGAGGVGKFLKKAATGEGVQLMRCTGQGEVFFASDADQVHILHLEGSALSVNGRNVLAFEPSLDYDIQRVQGAGVLTGGLWNTRLSGHGWVAITTKGQPVVLHTDQPTFGDPQAVVAWSADLRTSLNKTVKAKALVGLGSGEAFQLAFEGHGIVIVQPAEHVVTTGTS